MMDFLEYYHLFSSFFQKKDIDIKRFYKLLQFLLVDNLFIKFE
ncbi:MAG TPA: hypothetical protein DHV15_09420 [Treponema sp.]|uniref:Uncharacterized protein n=1 Tax=Treponema denticola (strain ATCC 35405 / DSM 14222 / CIP 103919 / JCM 8153 / KCTC 15104) TaxID=243275 RepID=Q73R73_TREDE|nr:hypothetical protein TDE_0218 [Treponema denticola ATCC 35405]HCY95713.1 hypothetical protein [Treponema sp.]